MHQQVDEYSILKTKKPGQHDDKPFQEVVCKINKDKTIGDEGITVDFSIIKVYTSN